METFNWQTIIVILLGLAAVFYVGKIIYKAIKGETHDCAGCDINDLPKKKQSK